MAKGKKNKKKTKMHQKDKDAPKRHIGAFFVYNLERREKLKKEKPELDSEEYAKFIMNEWNDLDDAKKKPYVEKAIAEQEKYKAEKESFERYCNSLFNKK